MYVKEVNSCDLLQKVKL